MMTEDGRKNPSAEESGGRKMEGKREGRTYKE
jgi:hypothetical protein